jgi:dihydroorotase
VVDLDAAWTCDTASLRSRSRNTPFSGRSLRGRAALTVVGGTIAYSSPDWGEGLT